jgi:hypothetical protein
LHLLIARANLGLKLALENINYTSNQGLGSCRGGITLF